jgi:hypothetical protein
VVRETRNTDSMPVRRPTKAPVPRARGTKKARRKTPRRDPQKKDPIWFTASMREPSWAAWNATPHAKSPHPRVAMRETSRRCASVASARNHRR